VYNVWSFALLRYFCEVQLALESYEGGVTIHIVTLVILGLCLYCFCHVFRMDKRLFMESDVDIGSECFQTHLFIFICNSFSEAFTVIKNLWSPMKEW
jgi:hypothetical protein